MLSRVMLDMLAPVGGLYISDADRNAGFVDGGCTCELSRRSLLEDTPRLLYDLPSN